VRSGFSRTYILRQPEIQQLDAGLRQRDVVRLQVAMDDALAVRGVERVADLRGVLERLVERQWALQGCAFHVLHHQEAHRARAEGGGPRGARLNAALKSGLGIPGSNVEPPPPTSTVISL